MVLIYFAFCSSFLWFGLVLSESLRTLVSVTFHTNWNMARDGSRIDGRIEKILFVSIRLLVAVVYYVPCTAGRITGKLEI